MKKLSLFTTLLLLVAFVTASFAATAYRKFTTDETPVAMQEFTPDPTKSVNTASDFAKGTKCIDTTNILKFSAKSTRASNMGFNTYTSSNPYPMAANTDYVRGIARYGTGNSHTVTQVCFSNQSGASLSFQAQ